jgi:hypothetical protein
MCILCDTAHNMFYDPIALTCQSCQLTQCAICSSLTVCSVCNSFGIYILNATFECELCTIPLCTMCLTLTECGQCNVGFEWDSTVSQCLPNIQICYIPGQTDICELYCFYKCVTCSETTDYTTCVTCADGFFQDGSGKCSLPAST